MRGTQSQHDQTIKTQSNARCRGHQRDGLQKILVNRIARAIKRLFERHILFKAGLLFNRIGQFPEAVGQFYPAGIELEPFREQRIVGFAAGQGGFMHGIIK